MQTKTWKWLAPAAAAAIGGILLLWPGASGNGKAYGMSDVPSLLRSSRILHIQGWGYDPTTAAPGKEPRRGPFEWWLDLENGRMHRSMPNWSAATGEEPPVLASTWDGQYRMEEVFTKHVGGGYTMGVKYQKTTPFLARWEVSGFVQIFLVQVFGKADMREGFQKVGQEAIHGTPYDIWQGETDMGSSGYQIKFRSWLQPRTGSLERVQAWIKMPAQQADWIPAWDLEKIERNVPVPDGVFSTDPPQGYTLHNTKETAPRAELPVQTARGTADRPRLHMLFTLEDGTVILAWSVTGKAISCPQETYAGLTPGGPLPDLPHRITTVEPMPGRAGVQYVPRHLAFTVRDGVYYEWSLHVPVGAVAPRSSFLMYRLAEKEQPGWGLTNGSDLQVRSPNDFDTWVRGAMAELSDSGAPPDGITYDYVMELSRQIRASVPADAAATQPAVSASAGK